MQSVSVIEWIAILLILGGIILVAFGLLESEKPSVDSEKSSRNKGIILLGPIPIVWGFGNKGKIIMALLFIILVTVYLFYIF